MVGRVLPFFVYGWISQVVINNRGNKAFVFIIKQSHLFVKQGYVFQSKDMLVKQGRKLSIRM